jgi:alanyl-tRNA synthetase
VGSTADIRAFRILKEEATAAGVRRIIAVAGAPAEARAASDAAIAAACAQLLGLETVADGRVIEEIALAFKLPAGELGELPAKLGQQLGEVKALSARFGEDLPAFTGDLAERARQLAAALKKLRKREESESARQAAGSADSLLEQAVDLGGGATLLAARVDGLDAKGLGALAEAVRAKKPGVCVVLIGESAGKAAVLAAVAKELLPRGLSAGAIVQRLAGVLGGRGGGKPDLAQGGGGDPAKIAAALEQVPAMVRQALGAAAAS